MSDEYLDTLDFISETGRKALRHLGHELANGNVVLFAGAGLSFNAPSKDGGVNRMPGWNAIADILREQLENNIKDKWDVLKVADYYETAFGRNALVDKIIAAVRDEQHVPGRVHQRLAQLNFREIITTNYDTLIERAFRSLYVTPQVVVEGRDLVRRRQPPRIIKMNGCFERHPGNIVVTGDDFLSHSERDPLIEVFVTKSFVESQVLFVGFSLNDPAFRAINERVLRTLGDDCPLAFSLQFGAATTEVAYWRTRQVQVIDLKSGLFSERNEEERIYRVIDALLHIQRTRLAPSPRREPVKPASLAPNKDGWPSPATLLHNAFPSLPAEAIQGCLSAERDALAEGTLSVRVSVLQKAFPSLSPQAIEVFLSSSGKVLAESILGVGAVWRRAFPALSQRTIESFLSSDGKLLAEGILDPHGADLPRPAVRQRLADFLSSATGLAGVEEPPLQNDKEWASVSELVSLISQGMEGESIESAPDAALTVLCALFALQYAVAAPSPENDERALSTAARLTFECLVSFDMAVRCRYLFLLLLLAPLDTLARLVTCWISTANERDLFDAKDARVEPTPEEYRLPILSFFGVLQERPVFYKKAAESLWSRELLGSVEADKPRYEATLRYRYLLQLAKEHADEWPGVHLHRERLERVLGSHAMDDEDNRGAGSYGSSLQGMLTELARGWLFGSPVKVRYLKRTLHQVKTARTSPELKRMSLLMTLVATLPVEGSRAIALQAATMEDAWHAGALDIASLLRYVAMRVDGGLFTRFVFSEDGKRQKRALGEYEDGLAALAEWLVERIDEEAATSTLRETALTRLAPALEKWLPQSESEVTRTHLTRVLTVMNSWNPARMRPIFEAWLKRQLVGNSNGTLPLATLDPDGTLIADREHARQLVARARARNGRADLRSDVEKWLIRAADRPLDERVVRDLAIDLVEALEAEQRTFGWIARAARVYSSTCVKAEVQKQSAIRKAGGLAQYVVGRLHSLDEHGSLMWPAKRNACLADLSVFSRDLDLAQRQFLLKTVEPEELTMEGREGAVLLAIRMMDTAANRGDAPQWAACLALLVDGGATGRGSLGPYIDRLPLGYAQKIESNLLVTLERHADYSDPSVVGMILRTIEESTDGSFLDLEAMLCHLLIWERRPFALAAAQALLRLSKSRPAVITRNGHRILRAQKVIRGRDPLRAFRSSSAFSAHLETLVGLISSGQPTSTLTPSATPKLPVRGKGRPGRRASR